MHNLKYLRFTCEVLPDPVLTYYYDTGEVRLKNDTTVAILCSRNFVLELSNLKPARASYLYKTLIDRFEQGKTFNIPSTEGMKVYAGFPREDI